MTQRTWWKFSPDLCDQPEVQELARLLDLPAFAAAGAVALLYAWAINFADDSGGINDYTEKAVETACRWEGPRGELARAFHASGILTGDFLDRDDSDPLRVALWEDVAGDIIDKREQARKRQQKRRCVTHNAMQPVTRDNICDITQPVTRTKKEELKNKEEQNREIKNIQDASASPRRKAAPRADGLFERFWTVYPRKVAKQNAEKAWNKLNPDETLAQQIITAVERFRLDPQWTKDNGQYIPHAATFLNGRRWEDETEVKTHGINGNPDAEWDEGLDEEGREELRRIYARECMGL